MVQVLMRRFLNGKIHKIGRTFKPLAGFGVIAGGVKRSGTQRAETTV
jgi:hypothetical protein